VCCIERADPGAGLLVQIARGVLDVDEATDGEPAGSGRGEEDDHDTEPVEQSKSFQDSY
jgi:hypothetical protein